MHKKSEACIHSLERQVATHSEELPSARGNLTWLEESVAVGQRWLADAQSAIRPVEGKRDKNRRHLHIEQLRGDGWRALVRGLRSLLVGRLSFCAVQRCRDA